MDSKIILLICVFTVICIAITVNKLLLPKLNPEVRKGLRIVCIIAVVTCLAISSYMVLFSNQYYENESWNAELMNYKELHKYSTGKSQTLVLIDSGISDYQAKQVKQNVNLTGDNNEFDVNGHGTIMLSILKGIGAKIVGIAPDVEVVSIKIIDKPGSSTKENLGKALETASTMQDVSVVNLSMGSYLSDAKIEERINALLDKGVTVVVSTGDYETDEMLFPASMNRVISVGALSANGKPWDFTNGSDQCIILAPGDEIKSMNMGGDIEYSSGTSQSAILISGYISLLKDYSYRNGLEITNIDIMNILSKINNNIIKYEDGFSEIRRNK